jgi:hypothetical protein
MKQIASRLHGVISQKIELFIITPVRTSNPSRFIHVRFEILSQQNYEECGLLGSNAVY